MYKENYKEKVIKKIREIIKVFKTSPVRNNILQSYAKDILKMDCD